MKTIPNKKNQKKENKILYTLILSILILTIYSCKSNFVRNKEARDDQEKYLEAVELQSAFKNIITADFETDPVFTSHYSDDAADDPAIWYNTYNPNKSVIFGSNKKGSLDSYNLSGKKLQSITIGKINNIDIRKGILLGNQKMDIIAGSNRTNNSIVLFKIDTVGTIKNQPDFTINLGDFEPYGFCLYKDEKNILHAFVNSKNGSIYQYKVNVDSNGKFKSDLVRKLKLDTQVEGMVVDDQNHKLYVGEEEKGIFMFSARENNRAKGKLLNESTSLNKNISYDIEGLALLPPNYLVASSQGNFSYAIFDLKNNKYVDSFIIQNGKIDGVEETDGLEILNINLGNNFPKGILVVHDGFNFDNGKNKNQNYKIIDLEKVISIIEK